MRKAIIYVLLSVLATGAASGRAYASEYVELRESVYAIVDEAIDGQTLKVRPQGAADSALVRLIGVDAAGSDAAFRYLNESLLGKTVILTFDALVPSPEGRFSMVYVSCDGQLINALMLQNGYAAANGAHERASMFYGQFPYYTNLASGGFYGYSGYYDGYYDDYYYYGSGVNINTATASQLESALTDVDWQLAERIVEYREDNGYFATVREIRNVSGMTDGLYDANRRYMTVCTNINAASRQELLSLGIGSAAATDIIEYRRVQDFDSKSELYTESIISRSLYDDISRYVDVYFRSSI